MSERRTKQPQAYHIRGGYRRAAKLTAKRRREIARMGGLAKALKAKQVRRARIRAPQTAIAAPEGAQAPSEATPADSAA